MRMLMQSYVHARTHVCMLVYAHDVCACIRTCALTLRVLMHIHQHAHILHVSVPYTQHTHTHTQTKKNTDKRTLTRTHIRTYNTNTHKHTKMEAFQSGSLNARLFSVPLSTSYILEDTKHTGAHTHTHTARAHTHTHTHTHTPKNNMYSNRSLDARLFSWPRAS